MNKSIAVLALSCTIAATGCAPLALTAMGIGMSTGVSHTLGGIVYKTFTLPQGNVEKATYGALNRMQIKVTGSKRDGTTKVILARAGDRDVEVELEALTPNTTRMVVTARKDSGLLRDGATATEIILQTERIVGPT
jgi:hypothetical protein